MQIRTRAYLLFFFACTKVLVSRIRETKTFDKKCGFVVSYKKHSGRGKGISLPYTGD